MLCAKYRSGQSKGCPVQALNPSFQQQPSDWLHNPWIAPMKHTNFGLITSPWMPEPRAMQSLDCILAEMGVVELHNPWIVPRLKWA